MPGDSGQADTPTLEVNEEQDVVCHQPPPGEHFDCEEIDAGQHRHLRLKKFLPGRGLAPFRCWRNPLALQDIPYGLIRNVVTEIGQRAHNAVVSPTGILFGHLRNQDFQFRFDSGRAGKRRYWEPSNLWAISLRYQARMVSGLAREATWARALHPSRFPISANVDLSG